MKLEHYRKLYGAEFLNNASELDKITLIDLLMKRMTISDWKLFEKTKSAELEEGESS